MEVLAYLSGISMKHLHRLCFTILTLWMYLPCIKSTHFRGGHIWFTPTGQFNNREIKINHRVAWKASWRDNTWCNDTIIRQEKLIGPDTAGTLQCNENCGNNQACSCVGHLMCIQSCGNYYRCTCGPASSMKIYCTDFSVIEDWSAGEASEVFIAPESRIYNLTWQGTGWLNVLEFGSDAPWMLKVTSDVRKRQDTGLVNSSPFAPMTTIISVKLGCDMVIDIPVSDPDGDSVKCRWGEQQQGECGGICRTSQAVAVTQNGRSIEMDQERCRVTLPPNIGVGKYALAIQLEDYVRWQQKPLSSVPLQFIVSVIASTVPCDAHPVFVAPTPAQGTCVYFPAGTTHSFPVIARSSASSVSIREITTRSSLGMYRGALQLVSRPGSSYQDWAIEVFWQPSSDDVGRQPFCFSATDSEGSNTGQHCISIVVGLQDPPEVKSIEYYEISDELKIFFKDGIYVSRPMDSAYIRILDEESKELLAMDASDSSQVKFKTEDVTIDRLGNLDWKLMRYVELDEGIVQGVDGCSKSPLYKGNENRFTVIFHCKDQYKCVGTKINEEDPVPVSNTDDGGKDYTWLILAVVGALIVIAVIIIIVVVMKRKKDEQKKEKYVEQDGEMDGYGAATPKNKAAPTDPDENFHDISVKYR